MKRSQESEVTQSSLWTSRLERHSTYGMTLRRLVCSRTFFNHYRMHYLGLEASAICGGAHLPLVHLIRPCRSAPALECLWSLTAQSFHLLRLRLRLVSMAMLFPIAQMFSCLRLGSEVFELALPRYCWTLTCNTERFIDIVIRSWHSKRMTACSTIIGDQAFRWKNHYKEKSCVL